MLRFEISLIIFFNVGKNPRYCTTVCVVPKKMPTDTLRKKWTILNPHALLDNPIEL